MFHLSSSVLSSVGLVTEHSEEKMWLHRKEGSFKLKVTSWLITLQFTEIPPNLILIAGRSDLYLCRGLLTVVVARPSWALRLAVPSSGWLQNVFL